MPEVRDELAKLAAGRDGDTTTILLARTDLGSAAPGSHPDDELPGRSRGRCRDRGPARGRRRRRCRRPGLRSRRIRPAAPRTAPPARPAAPPRPAPARAGGPVGGRGPRRTGAGRAHRLRGRSTRSATTARTPQGSSRRDDVRRQRRRSRRASASEPAPSSSAPTTASDTGRHRSVGRGAGEGRGRRPGREATSSQGIPGDLQAAYAADQPRLPEPAPVRRASPGFWDDFKDVKVDNIRAAGRLHRGHRRHHLRAAGRLPADRAAPALVRRGRRRHAAARRRHDQSQVG